VYKRLRNFRADIETMTSFLKRSFGLRHCTWRGLASFESYAWASVVTANLLVMARHLLRSSHASAQRGRSQKPPGRGLGNARKSRLLRELHDFFGRARIAALLSPTAGASRCRSGRTKPDFWKGNQQRGKPTQYDRFSSYNLERVMDPFEVLRRTVLPP